MKVVSFDCANKSLGVSIVNYNLSIADEIKAKYDTYLLEKAELLCEKVQPGKAINQILAKYVKLLDTAINLLKNKITIEFLDVVDLIPGKKISETDPVYRTSKLYEYLNNVIDPLISQSTEYIFLLEFQMGPNVKSGTVSSQIMYHLMKYKHNDNIKLIGPSLKNKVVIGGESNNYSNFIEKYNTNYSANKAHSKQNFLDLLKYLNSEYMIKNIKKKNIDDIADSVLMSLAYILYN
jgi:hypothetical protein